MNINLTAVIKAKPGNAELVKGLLLKLVEGSTKEEACIQYDLHQSADDENIFIFHEIWDGENGLALHNSQPHLKEFQAAVAAILDGPVVLYRTNRLN